MEGKWSEPWSGVTDPTCMASLVSHPSGTLVFANPNHPKHRENLTIRTSLDGRAWSGGRVLDPGGAMYSAMTILRDGQIGIVYESGSPRGLTFACFPLAWISEGQK